jgi:uncharacterized membrane protein
MDEQMLSWLRARVKNIQLSKVEISLFLLLLIFGVPMILLIPPGAGYDEEDHLVRVWELSASSFIPGQMPPRELRYPTLFRDFAYRQQGSSGVIGPNFWQSYARAPIYEYGFVRREIDTKSVYSPGLLLPQSIVMRSLARVVELPALTVFYLCRLAGLSSYLILTWLALRQIPFGKWILLVLAASPMALFQAATLTPDSISNGIGFLFVAGCLRIAQTQEIHWREIGILIVLTFLLFLAKLNLLPLILLLFLLIPPSRFRAKGSYVFLLVITFFLFVVEVAGWNWIASRNFGSLVLQEANPRAQFLHIVSHPLAFLQTVLNDFFTNGWTYFQGWINGYGYYYWTPPQIVSLLFLLSLAIVLFADSTLEKVSKNFRTVFLLVFVAGYLATLVSIYASFAPVGSTMIFGVQGRYFVPLALPVFLAVAGIPQKGISFVASPQWGIAFLATALSINLLGIFFSFHVPCGSTFYHTGLCYRPLFRDFPSEVRASKPVSNGISLSQEISVACDGLTEVRVLVAASNTKAQGATRFLLEDPSGEQTLLDATIVNIEIPTDAWHSLRFAPDWDSAGKGYILKILGTTDQGLQFLYTPQSEFNLGDSYENGQLLEEDIVLQYGCMAGLRKIWLTGWP